MAFILRRDRPQNTADEAKTAWKSYSDYLESVKDTLPKSAYEFATASWHYDFSHHQSPHDGWLEHLIIREPSSGDRRQIRSLEISVRLLAAYHDGFIELTYKNVRSYTFKHGSNLSQGHDDWLYDEIRVSENGFVLHEIEWVNSDWLIECEDVFYEWKPFENTKIEEINA